MSELTTIHKWYWVWDFEKEEEWLNQMAEEGQLLDGVGWCTYRFRNSLPGEYVIRLDLDRNDGNFHELLADAGAECIGKVFKWAYYRRRTDEGPFELYNDIDSKEDYLNRIIRFIGIVCILNLAIGLLGIANDSPAAPLNMLCAALLAYAIGRIHGKKEVLQKERKLHE